MSGTSRCHQKPAEIQRAGDTGRQGYEEVRGQKKTEDIKKAARQSAGGDRKARRREGKKAGARVLGNKKLPIAKSYRELSVAGTGFEPATSGL